MFSFLKKDTIPDDKLSEVGMSLVATMQEQLRMAAASKNFELKVTECVQSGYLIGYIFGLSTAYGSVSCKDNMVKKEAIGENIQRLYDFIVYNTFGQNQLENYKSTLENYIATPSPAFQHGEFDGIIDSRTKIECGEFAKFLAGRLIAVEDPRDDIFILSFKELSEIAMTGDTSAQIEMASRYSKGRDVEKNMGRATELYCLATLGGHPQALSLFQASAECLTSEQLNQVRKNIESFDFETSPDSVSNALDEIFSSYI